MNIGTPIKIVRKLRGVTQSDLAQGIGISSTALSQIELSDSFPKQSTIKSICDYLNVSEDLLYMIGFDRAHEKTQNIPYYLSPYLTHLYHIAEIDNIDHIHLSNLMRKYKRL